jgi:hypothetical protein
VVNVLIQGPVEVGVSDASGSAYLDPAVVQAARVIYETYYHAHPELTEPPLGVAINRFTRRGKLIFSGKPILLPQECFVPFEVIAAEY